MAEETKSAAMPTDLKLKNRIKILDVFRKNEKLSINEAAEFTGISRQTVVKSINFFLEKSLIASLGKGNSTEIGGKRPELYSFNSCYKYILCACISAKSVIVALMDLQRNIISEESFQIRRTESIITIAENIGIICLKILKKHKISKEDLYSLGVCTSGIYNKSTGIMRYNSIFPNWGEDIPMLDIFKNVIPKNCKIIIDNEAKVSGAAELVKDPSLKEKRVLTIYTGEGIAAALISSGVIAYGKNSLIGEIGHLTLEDTESAPCGCGLRGCFEHIVREEKLLKMYGENVSCLEEIFEAANSEEAFEKNIKAREVILYAAGYFAAAIRNMILLTDPDIIVIQGKFAKAGDFFVSIIKDKMREFKYFGKNANFDIRLDTSDIKDLCIMGMAEMLTDDLFSNEDIYKDA